MQIYFTSLYFTRYLCDVICTLASFCILMMRKLYTWCHHKQNSIHIVT